MSSYGVLCTEFYDRDKPSAPRDALDFYTRKARAAAGRVLEPLCGSGRFLVPMIRAGLVVDGTDASPSMLEACRHHLAASGLHAELFEQSLEALSLPHRYDLAFIPSGSIGLLSTDEALRAALTRLRQHLNPGAPLLLEFTDADAEPEGPVDAELTPRSVDCGDGAVITYSCSAHRRDAAGPTVFRGRYVKSMNGQVIGTEDEVLAVRSFPVAELVNVLRGCGFATVRLHTAQELSFLADDGCLLAEAS